MPQCRGQGVRLGSNVLRKQGCEALDALPENDNRPFAEPDHSTVEAVADEFRSLATWLILAAAIIAIALTAALRVEVDPAGTAVLDWVIASLLLVSRMWWERRDHHRIADACGTVAVVSMGGMACGAIAMLELRLHFPIADPVLRSWDLALGIDGITIVDGLARQGHWVFRVMAPAYNFTVPIFFAGMVILALFGNRIEAWRAAFCFVGTLLTTCLIAIVVPAKGLAMWAPQTLLDRLPQHAMRTFWPHFDDFYAGAHPVLRLQVIDGVVSFPSFHSIVGFMTVAMCRKNIFVLIPGALYVAIMLAATLPGGGHYVVDLLGGLVVWTAWFAWSRLIEEQIARGREPSSA